MGYKMGTVKGNFGGPSGRAKVSTQKDKKGNVTKVKVAFIDEDGNPADSFIIPIDDCSEEVKGYIQSGEFKVRLGKDGKSLIAMSPWSGMFRVHTIGFAHQKDKPPVPMVKTGKTGDQSWSYQYFMPLLEIAEGDCKGMVVSYFLKYLFEGVEIEFNGKKGVAAQFAHPKSPSYPVLVEYCETTGITDAPIPWSDNILPALEKRILRKDNHFTILVKKGFVDSLYEESNLKPDNEPLPDDPFDQDDAKETAAEATEDKTFE
jgi:hypothetical protein